MPLCSYEIIIIPGLFKVLGLINTIGAYLSAVMEGFSVRKDSLYYLH